MAEIFDEEKFQELFYGGQKKPRTSGRRRPSVKMTDEEGADLIAQAQADKKRKQQEQRTAGIASPMGAGIAQRADEAQRRALMDSLRRTVSDQAYEQNLAEMSRDFLKPGGSLIEATAPAGRALNRLVESILPEGLQPDSIAGLRTQARPTGAEEAAIKSQVAATVKSLSPKEVEILKAMDDKTRLAWFAAVGRGEPWPLEDFLKQAIDTAQPWAKE